MSEVLRTARPKARKEHRCEWCRTTINPGDTYSRQTCAYDGRLYDWVACLACLSISHVVSAYWGHPSEGIDETSYHDWAEENAEDERAVAWLSRVNNLTTADEKGAGR